MYTPQEHDMMQEFMGQAVVSKLKVSGEGVKVYPCAKICSPERVAIGDHTRLCDYVLIHPEHGEITLDGIAILSHSALFGVLAG